MSAHSDKVLLIDSDMNNLETETDTLAAKDLAQELCFENEGSYLTITDLDFTAMPSTAGPTDTQEESPKLSREDASDTIIVKAATSDRGSESSDDSDDGDYTEGSPQPIKKSKRVKFSKTINYGSQEAPLSPADTCENGSQGTAETCPDIVYTSEEIPICGVLTLKEIDSEIQYCITFSQDSLRFLAQTQTDMSGTSTRTHSARAVSPSVRRHGKCPKYSEEEDELLIDLKEVKNLSWDEIKKEFPGRSKLSLQVHYSTKLKDHLGTSETPKSNRKRQRGG